jgi:hypothetical protein
MRRITPERDTGFSCPQLRFALICQFVQVYGPIGSFEQSDYNVDEFHMTRRNSSNYSEAKEIMPSVSAMCYCASKLTGLWPLNPMIQ